MASTRRGRIAALLTAIALGCLGAVSASDAPDDVALSGGATSLDDATRDAFTRPAANISDAHRRAFMVGQAVFNQNWVASPSNNRDRQGLGPLFNARSCSSCHAKAGRAAPIDADGALAVGLLLRLSIDGADPHGAPLPEPNYGGQFHPAAILGVAPDGVATVGYVESPGRYADGEPYALRRPTYRLTGLAYGAISAQLRMSPRIAPALCGLGLLEAVPEATVLALAHAQRDDPDGVRGHPNRVWDVRAGAPALGRFGWKAGQPTLEQQDAAAFVGDIGITSALFADEALPSSHVAAASHAAHDPAGTPEVAELRLRRLDEWSHLIAVPMRRRVDEPAVGRGAALFARFRCDACHIDRIETGVDARFPELAAQVIHPYTDLLLHDLGPGLADDRAEYAAGGRDWRTPPLWGIGLVEVVADHTCLLHDGRARGFAEAILWHDGEGRAARDRFVAASAAERAELIAFLGSL